jgi:hypothetical protein
VPKGYNRKIMNRTYLDQDPYFRHLLSLHGFYSDSLSAIQQSGDPLWERKLQEIQGLLGLVRQKGNGRFDALVCSLVGSGTSLPLPEALNEELQVDREIVLRKRGPIRNEWMDLQRPEKKVVIGRRESEQPFKFKESTIHNQKQTKVPYTSLKHNEKIRETGLKLFETASKMNQIPEKISQRTPLMPLIDSENTKRLILDDMPQYEYGDPLLQVIPGLKTNHGNFSTDSNTFVNQKTKRSTNDDLADLFLRNTEDRREEKRLPKLSFELESSSNSSICSVEQGEIIRFTSSICQKEDPLYCYEEWPLKSNERDYREKLPQTTTSMATEALPTYVKLRKSRPQPCLRERSLEKDVSFEKHKEVKEKEKSASRKPKKNFIYSGRRKGGGRKTLDPQMEARLLLWLAEKTKQSGEIPTRRLIRDTALTMADPNCEFKASKGWCDKFLARNKSALGKSTRNVRG